MDNLSYEEGWKDAGEPVEYERYTDPSSESPPEKPKKKPKKKGGKPLVLIVQLGLCLLMVLSAYVVKTLGGRVYGELHSWYQSELSDEIILNSDFESFSLKELIDDLSR